MRARDHHSPSFAYVLSSRKAIALPSQVSPFLQTYKSGRARLLIEEYAHVTPRNGRYSRAQHDRRAAFEILYLCHEHSRRNPEHSDHGSPSIERQKRRIELRPPVAEYEPIVAQLRKSGEIEGRRQHGIAFLGRLGDFAAGGIGNER